MEDKLDIDNVLNVIRQNIKLDGSEWELLGFISRSKQVLAFGSDSKILGRLF